MSRLEDPALPITLNVGGQIFTTTLNLLRQHHDSALAAIFRPPVSCPRDPRDGSYFLDRNGQTFGMILDYLRTGSLTVPRDPVGYSQLRREVVYFGLPVAMQLPQIAPALWQSAPKRYRHARIVVDELEKQVEWEEGSLPQDLSRRTVLEIISFFGAQGYRVASEYVSRGSTGYTSVWLVKEEVYPGADVPLEVKDLMTSSSSTAPAPAGGSAGMMSNHLGAGAAGFGGGGNYPPSSSSSNYAQPNTMMMAAPYSNYPQGGSAGGGGGGGALRVPQQHAAPPPIVQPSYAQVAPEGLRNIPTYSIPPR